MPTSTGRCGSSVSMSSTRFMRDTPITSASSAGSAPPDSDVPAPRATTLMSLAWQ